MRIRPGVLATVALLLALGAWVSAQFLEDRFVQTPTTLSGNDVGFRVEAVRGDAVAGTLVVRVNGKWIDAQTSGGPKKLTTR